MAQTVIRWRLAEIMARHRISGNDLAEYLGVNGNAVSNLKNAETMPRINGHKLNNICNGVSKLSGVVVTPHDLLEFTLDKNIHEDK